MGTLTGHVTIVAGTAWGLGRAIAQGPAQEGAAVVAADKRIDILVNNADTGTVAHLWETPTDVWHDIMAINVRGPFLPDKISTTPGG